jgi:hypothetical protein
MTLDLDTLVSAHPIIFGLEDAITEWLEMMNLVEVGE